MGLQTPSTTPSYLDRGAAAVALLTSCDTGLDSEVGFGSWCGMIQQNATCELHAFCLCFHSDREAILNHGCWPGTMEAWNPKQKPNLSFSHPGGTSAMIAIVEGFMGIRPLEPGFASFIVQPQPGDVHSASIRVPTLRGFIEASFTTVTVGASTSLELNTTIPANSRADLCIPAVNEAASEVLVDGKRSAAARRGGFLCAVNLGAQHGPRVVRPYAAED